jgi:hypothetical protein
MAGREISGRLDMGFNVDCLMKSGLPISGSGERFQVRSAAILFSNGSASA